MVAACARVFAARVLVVWRGCSLESSRARAGARRRRRRFQTSDVVIKCHGVTSETRQARRVAFAALRLGSASVSLDTLAIGSASLYKLRLAHKLAFSDALVAQVVPPVTVILLHRCGVSSRAGVRHTLTLSPIDATLSTLRNGQHGLRRHPATNHQGQPAAAQAPALRRRQPRPRVALDRVPALPTALERRPVGQEPLAEQLRRGLLYRASRFCDTLGAR